MEILKEKIEAFLDVGSGDGSGDGNGDGNGSGYGDGNGDGNGNGYGDGNGDGNGNGSGDGYGNGNGNGSGYGNGDGTGSGSGYGSGYGISEINGMKVWKVDGIPTIITNIHGNIAEGYTLQRNVILVPCYIVKVGNFFAHGTTVHQALLDAQEKYETNKPLSERIADTVAKYPTLDTVVSHTELYALHHTLTGSCRFGRDEFAANHGLDPEQGEMTMRQFINLTMDAYGGDAIKELLHAYTTTL